MIFKTKKKEKHLSIYHENKLLFQGSLYHLPLREDIIIEKSILFFRDPEPCLIHRNAVKIRLLSEIEQLLSSGCSSLEAHKLLHSYADFNCFDKISYIE